MKYDMMITVATSVLVTVEADDTWLAEGKINNNMIFDAIVASRESNNLWFDHAVEWITECSLPTAEEQTPETVAQTTQLEESTKMMMGFIDEIIAPRKKEVL